jgi:hypothetical protein
MPLIDLRNHIIQQAGTWCDEALLSQETPFPFSLADTLTAGRLMLRWPGDLVSLTGPLRLRVTYQSENVTFRAGSAGMLHQATIQGRLSQANQAVLSQASQATLSQANQGAQPQATLMGATLTGEVQQRQVLPQTTISISAASLQASTLYSYTLDVPAGEVWSYQFGTQELPLRLGANLGTRLIIEAALGEQVLQPMAQVSELPCDFAVADLQDTARFFPAACEPCAPGAQIGLPPGGPSLAIPTADGGCIRPRFFNGMFITKEDLEAEQRYMRMKLRLQNRASGQGVVWGLNVGKQGNTVCVLPGYAVDCCGNDLTVTTLYKVDISTLLRDPAAAAALGSGKPQRMHLLLEYVECPSDPRPVHADPCASGTERCEMSRVRETVRLRLVPPRDPSTAGPIQSFIDRVKALRARYKVDDQVPEYPLRAPFRVEIRAFTQQGEVTAWVRPGETPSLGELNSAQGVSELRLRLRFDQGEFSQFVRGTVDARTLEPSGLEEILLNHVVLAPVGFEFNEGSIAVGSLDQRDLMLTYALAQWATQPALAPADTRWLQGNLKITITLSRTGVFAQVTDAGVASIPADIGQGCAGEPCVPPGAPAVLPQLPWLHTDPIWDDVPADPKALVLAALGGWLTELMAREQAGTAKESLSVRRLLASALYDSTWLLFFGVEQGEGRNDIHESLRQLFRAWCENLLYKGPQCVGEPHGVVIGCTQVAGGTLGEIDPFGGRRWVMHYPLISHWGAQFGMAPVDVTASRFFSTICCISALPPPGSHENKMDVVAELGTGFLTFGTPAAIAEKLQQRENLVLVESKTVSFAEFVAHFIRAATKERDEGEQPARTTAIRYTLGNPMAPKVLSLVMPLDQKDTPERGREESTRLNKDVAQPMNTRPLQPTEQAVQPGKQPIIAKAESDASTGKAQPRRAKKDKS